MSHTRLALVTDKTMGELRKRVAKQEIAGFKPTRKGGEKKMKMEKMRKAFSILAILLLSTFAVAQTSDPVVMDISFTLETGAGITLSETVVSSVIPVPLSVAEVGTFVPMDMPVAPIQLEVIGRLAGGGTNDLNVTCDSFFRDGEEKLNHAPQLIRFVFTSVTGPAGTFASPDIGDSITLWNSGSAVFSDSAELVVEFCNSLMVAGGNYSGSFTFQLFDAVI